MTRTGSAPVRIDLYTGDGLRLDAAAEVSQQAEAAGFGALWTLEAHTEPFLPLALAAEHTSRLQLGTAVAVALARNPMVLAHLAHELHRYCRGRFTLGLGSQVSAHITRRYGAPFDHPAARMTEFVGALRAIWACWNDGQPLDFQGGFYQHTLMTPAFNPGPSPWGQPRVLLAAVGPRMTEAACACADGLVAHPLSSPTSLSQMIKPSVAGAVRQGFELICPVLVVTGTRDAEIGRARDAVRRQLAFYASTPAYRPVMELYGEGERADRLRTMSRDGQWDNMAGLITDELLTEFSVEAPIQALPTALHARYDAIIDRALLYAPYPVAADLWQGMDLQNAGRPATE
jgi:probable F420-dependent oxidoreductase